MKEEFDKGVSLETDDGLSLQAGSGFFVVGNLLTELGLIFYLTDAYRGKFWLGPILDGVYFG